MAKPVIWMLYSTFTNRGEALSAAQSLLERRLIACANIMDGVTSVYRWEGQVKQENEAILIAKTQQSKLQEAMVTLKSLHSYDVPCITAYELDGGFPPFLQWVVDETEG